MSFASCHGRTGRVSKWSSKGRVQNIARVEEELRNPIGAPVTGNEPQGSDEEPCEDPYGRPFPSTLAAIQAERRAAKAPAVAALKAEIEQYEAEIKTAQLVLYLAQNKLGAASMKLRDLQRLEHCQVCDEWLGITDDIALCERCFEED